VRLRERIATVAAALARRERAGVPLGVVVISGRKEFHSALVEVGQALGRDGADVIGGLAYEPASAAQLHGEWGGKLDRSLLVRTARAIASQLAGAVSTIPPLDVPPVAAPPAATRSDRSAPARHRVNGTPRAQALSPAAGSQDRDDSRGAGTPPSAERYPRAEVPLADIPLPTTPGGV
jgi:hypothetical protein